VAAVPLLGGFLVHAFAQLPRHNRWRAPAMLGLLLAMPVVVERGVEFADQLAMTKIAPVDGTPSPARAKMRAALHCRTAEAMAEIATLPPSVVFTSLNLGPAVVVFTPHAATAAAYHRSAAAYWNGIGPFTDLATMKQALAESGADYLVLCRNSSDERVLADLPATGLPAWLTEVTGDRRSLRGFQVDVAALAERDAAP
jgi:hypothetical protein